MDVYSENSYKAALKKKVSVLQRENRSITLKKIAKRIKIQYTYLSKTLNDPSVHLSQDRLFRICTVLGMGLEETDFILLLREYEMADDPDWREHLYSRLERLRKERQLNSEVQQFSSTKLNNEMSFLFDPLATVILVSLFIPEYQKNPHMLCPVLGITSARLKKLLNTLSDVGHIELSENGLGVKKFLRPHIHYGRDHPLMRVHQNLMKTTIQSQLMRIPEEEKHSFLMTFNLTKSGFEECRAEVQKCIKRVEEIGKKCKEEGTYQISVDLFRWV